ENLHLEPLPSIVHIWVGAGKFVPQSLKEAIEAQHNRQLCECFLSAMQTMRYAPGRQARGKPEPQLHCAAHAEPRCILCHPPAARPATASGHAPQSLPNDNQLTRSKTGLGLSTRVKRQYLGRIAGPIELGPVRHPGTSVGSENYLERQGHSLGHLYKD